MVELTLVQKIILKLSGRVFTEYRLKPGWKAPIAFYAFKCPVHGIVEDFPQGYNNRLECPKCGYARGHVALG